jgi:hypothetical protein
VGGWDSTFVKAASSVFMKIRNSALDRVELFPSFPAYFWNTAIRDSMHFSVSVGWDIFAFGEKKNAGLRQEQDVKDWMLENMPENLISF